MDEGHPGEYFAKVKYFVLAFLAMYATMSILNSPANLATPPPTPPSSPPSVFQSTIDLLLSEPTPFRHKSFASHSIFHVTTLSQGQFMEIYLKLLLKKVLDDSSHRRKEGATLFQLGSVL